LHPDSFNPVRRQKSLVRIVSYVYHLNAQLSTPKKGIFEEVCLLVAIDNMA
jgi:hypothetical protein